MKAKLYTTKTCAYCPMVKKWFGLKNIEFELIDITENPQAGNDLHKRSGYTSVPVVEYGDKFVAGWQPMKLAELFV